MLLSTRNLRMKGTRGKLQRKFVGPFRVIETIGQQAYRLSLPNDWKIYPVFHVSFLEDWKTADLQEDQAVPTDDVPDVEEPYYEIERILRWRKIKRNKKSIKRIFSVVEGISSRGGILGPSWTIQSPRTIEELH